MFLNVRRSEFKAGNKTSDEVPIHQSVDELVRSGARLNSMAEWSGTTKWTEVETTTAKELTTLKINYNSYFLEKIPWGYRFTKLLRCVVTRYRFR